MLGRDDKQLWRQAQDLFHRARELESSERESFVDQHCRDDSALREELHGLLNEALSEDSCDTQPEGRRGEDLSGRHMGNYELLCIIGEGAMGVIYEARQRYVDRSVALKILRKRSDVLSAGGSPGAYERMTARFIDEAEILGRLDHPGIVPIHEMERDHEGRSYFTMRLVQGEDFRSIIDRVYARSSGWNLQRALNVIVRVCETMAFAHDRGVLHRDLKPSHIMVGRFGEVYIVDWGLAKVEDRPEIRDIRIRERELATESPVEPPGDPLLRTVEGDVIGTPAYMPPEQAWGRLEKVGTRSDVYAVGSVLYNLLTGHIPHLRSGEKSLGPREVLERVKHEALAPVHAFDPHVAPALAAICEKAMQRETERRYASMEELGDDLRAFIENRVVSAHRTGMLVEISKWLQRNRALAAALALSLLVGLGWLLSVLQIQSAANANLKRKNTELESAKERVQVERDSSREQAAIASVVNEFLDGMFRSIDPVLAQGEEVTVRTALDRAAERLAGSFPDQPQVEAAIRTTIGVTYRQLGHITEAEPHLAWALATRQRELGEEHPETLLSMAELASLLRDQGRLDEAEELQQRVLALNTEMRGAESPETLRSMGNLAQTFFDRGQLERAAQLAREQLELLERANANANDDPDAGAEPSESEDMLVPLEVLGGVHYRRQEYVQAEGYFRRQYEIDRKLFGDEHSNTLIAAMSLVSLLDAMGRQDEARETAQALRERLLTIFGPEHRTTILASANMALLLYNQGQGEQAVELFRETIAAEREVFGSEHPETMLTLFNLAEVLRRLERFGEARPLYLELLAWQRRQSDPEQLQNVMIGLSDAMTAVGALEEAVELLCELREIQLREQGEQDPGTRATTRQLAICYERLGWQDELRSIVPVEASTAKPAEATAPEQDG